MALFEVSALGKHMRRPYGIIEAVVRSELHSDDARVHHSADQHVLYASWMCDLQVNARLQVMIPMVTNTSCHGMSTDSASSRTAHRSYMQ